jgi:hypothetical protein
MYEQSKAAKRRMHQPAFLTRYFVGDGLDIGAGPDGLSRYVGVFPLMRSVRDWDLADGDAQYLHGVPDNSVDFVHSSHCLEHMHSPLTVPEMEMYERGHWPSQFNPDHKWRFTAKNLDGGPFTLTWLLWRQDGIELERFEVLREFFRPDDPNDQTTGPVTECAIEFVLRKL